MSTMNEEKASKFWWPDVSTLDAAKQAANATVAAAVMIAVVTLGLVIYSVLQEPILGVTVWSTVDIALYAVVAFGMRKMSRVAAVAGFVLYLSSLAYQASEKGLQNPVMALLFISFFITGIRGAFSYHRIVKKSQQPASK